MQEHADKNQENKSRAVANSKNNTSSTFQFVDNRPEAIQMHKFQEMANNYTQRSSLGFMDNRVEPKNQFQFQKPLNQEYKSSDSVMQKQNVNSQRVLQMAPKEKGEGKLHKGKTDLSPLLGRPKTTSSDGLHVIGKKAGLETESKGMQGAGLYVAGETPNRVLHQQHKPTPDAKIRGDHFELDKNAPEETLIPSRQGGVSSSDIKFQKPNFRGEQYRANQPIPPGWELRNDGKEVQGDQSEGHYSLRPVVEGKTLAEAAKVNHGLFQEKIGEVKEKGKKQNKTSTFHKIDEDAISERPMINAMPNKTPLTNKASSRTTEKDLFVSESHTQTHF